MTQLEKFFRQSRKFLEEFIDPDFGLIENLFSKGIINGRQLKDIKAKDTFYKRNSRLLDFISRERRINQFCDALIDSGQKHIVNYLNRSGERNPQEDEEEWPLTKEELLKIDTNYGSLVDLIDTSDLIGRLFSDGVINKRHLDFISSKSTSFEKNEILLEILRRSSLRSYWVTIKCLHLSNQSHIANTLETGGSIVRVHATLESDNLDETETEIVEEVTNLLLKRNVSTEKANRVLSAAQLNIIAINRGQSIVLYVYCSKTDEFSHLCEAVDNFEIKNFLENLFNLLIHNKKIKVLSVKILGKDKSKANELFASYLCLKRKETKIYSPAAISAISTEVHVSQLTENTKSLDVRPQGKVQTDVDKLHFEHEQRFHRRQTVDSDLRKISEDIRKQESELTKVQSNLQYRTEHKINEAIQRLETQLKTRNFRLSEEKRIVAEIDALKSSTKDLTLYLSVKKQIDEKRDQQRKLKDERDRLQKSVTEFKLKEESILQENQLRWEKAQIIKNDNEVLQKKVKDLQSTFNAQDKEYRQQKELMRRSKLTTSLSIRKDEDWRAACKQELEESESCPVPFAKEIFLCNTLIRHLQRLTAADEESAKKATHDAPSASHGSKLEMLNESFKGEGGMFLLRRKSDAEESQSPRVNTRVRKSKKRTPSMKKHIVHTLEIFDQFSQLELTAPASAAEVAESIKQLKEKLSSYENFSKDSLLLDKQNQIPDNAEQFNLFQGIPYKSSMASSANLYSESAVSGSMPTMPDVQFDASKFLPTSEYPRRRSQDSGTGDFDEQTLEIGASKSCNDD